MLSIPVTRDSCSIPFDKKISFFEAKVFTLASKAKSVCTIPQSEQKLCFFLRHNALQHTVLNFRD